ncbi:MAG: hypothetical protein ABW252_13825 [Polyangiales bacterium]
MTNDALDALALRMLAPLDAARAFMLRCAGPRLGPLLARPALRHAVLGSAGVVVAFVLSTTALVWLLALGPLVLGVPHLLADLRYLVIQPGLSRRPSVRALVLAPLLLTPLVLTRALPLLSLTGALVIASSLVARGTRPRRIASGVAGASIVTVGFVAGHVGAVVFAHLHHVIALGAWWSMRRDRGVVEALVPALVALGALVAGVGLLDDRLPDLLVSSADLLSPELLLATLTPDPSTPSSLRWVWLYAFGQSVHYLVWLRLVPDDRRGRPAPRPFSSSYRALRAELGTCGLTAAVAIALGLLAYALRGLDAARGAYLQLALFHGPLEVALLALALAERRRP